MLLPKPNEAMNVLVPVAVSASHVGFGCVRLEPTWMILGQAAGTLAAMAVEGSTAVQNVPVEELQTALRSAGQLVKAFEVPKNQPEHVCQRV